VTVFGEAITHEMLNLVDDSLRLERLTGDFLLGKKRCDAPKPNRWRRQSPASTTSRSSTLTRLMVPAARQPGGRRRARVRSALLSRPRSGGCRDGPAVRWPRRRWRHGRRGSRGANGDGLARQPQEPLVRLQPGSTAKLDRGRGRLGFGRQRDTEPVSFLGCTWRLRGFGRQSAATG